MLNPPPSPAPRLAPLDSEPKRWPAWIIGGCQVGLIVIFGYLLVYHFLHERHDHLHLGDFPTFYQGAQFARAHGDIYLAEASPEQPYIYPPLVAFAYVPLTFLSKLHAAELMLFVTAGMLAGSLFVGGGAMLGRFNCARPGTVLIVALCVAVLNENEMRLEMTMLETDALILLMFALSLYWLDHRPALSGVALAVVMNIKYLSLIMLPYLLIRRRWRAAASMVTATVAISLLPALLLGWSDNLRGIRIALGGLATWIGMPPPVLSNGQHIIVQRPDAKLSLSVTSFFARLCGPMHSQLTMGFVAATALAAFGAAWFLYRKNRLPVWIWPAADLQRTQPFRALIAIEWAGLIAGTLAFSPDTNPRHLVLAMLVNLLGVSVLLALPRLRWRRPALAGVLLICLGLVMPVRRWGPTFYAPYSIPGWSVLIGYFLILISAADQARQISTLPQARKPFERVNRPFE